MSPSGLTMSWTGNICVKKTPDNHPKDHKKAEAVCTIERLFDCIFDTNFDRRKPIISLIENQLKPFKLNISDFERSLSLSEIFRQTDINIIQQKNYNPFNAQRYLLEAGEIKNRILDKINNS